MALKILNIFSCFYHKNECFFIKIPFGVHPFGARPFGVRPSGPGPLELEGKKLGGKSVPENYTLFFGKTFKMF